MDQVERYRALLEINNTLISNLDRGDLFHAIARTLRRAVPFDRASIFLHDPDKNVLRLSVLESSGAAYVWPVGTEVSATDSHAGWVFRHGEPKRNRAQDGEVGQLGHKPEHEELHRHGPAVGGIDELR